MAQRRLDTIATSLAPACRCSQESLPGWSVSNSWCACLTVATFRPRLTSTGITLVTSVVLPEPLQPARPIMRMPALYGVHAERANTGAGGIVAQRGKESLHGRPLPARFQQQEIIFLRRNRQKRQSIEARHRLDGYAPVGSVLRDGRGYRVVRTRLVGVTGRPRAAQNPVDQHAGAGPG